MEAEKTVLTSSAMSKVTKTRLLAATGLLLMDLAVFAATAVFLPRNVGMFHQVGLVSYFANSRMRWDIAWGIFFAALLFSAGVFLLLEALGVFQRVSRNR
jgi:hypothetical protein